MTARNIGILGGLACLVLGIWFFSTHHRETRYHDILFHTEAPDPWDAGSRFLSSMGVPVETVRDLETLVPRLDTGDLVIVHPSRDSSPNLERWKELRGWVRTGGRVLLPFDRMPKVVRGCWIEGLGIARRGAPLPGHLCTGDWPKARLPNLPGSVDPDLLDDDPEPSGPVSIVKKVAAMGDSSRVPIGLPGGRSIRIAELDERALRWLNQDRAPLWEDPSGFYIEASDGAGLVKVVQTDDPFLGNDLVLRKGNAELLWRIAAEGGAPSRIWILEQRNTSNWLEILWDRAWPALIAGWVAVGFLLWRQGARFGPVAPEFEQEPAGILEHAAAAGRWLWSVPGGKAILFEALRKRSRRSLLARHPELARSDVPELAAVLSRETGAGSHELSEALGAEPPGDPRKFHQIARVHWTLRRRR